MLERKIFSLTSVKTFFTKQPEKKNQNRLCTVGQKMNYTPDTPKKISDTVSNEANAISRI